MASVNERLAALEERVLNQREVLISQAQDLIALTGDIKMLNKRLNYLIILLAGNFGLAFFKLAPLLKNLM